MITKIEVRSALGQLLTLELETTNDGLIVQDIDGLDPVKANLVSSSFAQLDGGIYQSSRRETRNMIITLGLDPDYVTTSVRDLRKQLYRFFMPKTAVNLRFFMEDDLVASIDARVETFDSILFTKDPKAIISLICFDPDFVDLTTVEISGDTVESTDEITVEYDGSVPTGILFTLMVDRTLEEFTIYHRAGDDVVNTLDFSANLEADDILTINTITGSKAVSLTRSSVVSSLLYGMSPQSIWIELQPGTNYIRIYAVGAAIPFTIDYTTRYGGL